MPNQSIQRGANILSLFSYSRPRLKVSQIAREIGLAVSTRCMAWQEGFLSQDRGLASTAWVCACTGWVPSTWPPWRSTKKAAIPLSYLARETGLVGRMGVLERWVIVITQPLSKCSVALFVGAAAPAYCISMSRAILAQLPEEELLA